VAAGGGRGLDPEGQGGEESEQEKAPRRSSRVARKPPKKVSLKRISRRIVHTAAPFVRTCVATMHMGGSLTPKALSLWRISWRISLPLAHAYVCVCVCVANTRAEGARNRGNARGYS